MDLKTNAFEYSCFLLYLLFGSLLSQDIIVSFSIPLTNAFCMIIVSYGSFNRLLCLSVFQTKCRFLACSCLNGSPCLVLGSCSVFRGSGGRSCSKCPISASILYILPTSNTNILFHFIHCINQLPYTHFLHYPIHNL